jgi:hypothetical protein
VEHRSRWPCTYSLLSSEAVTRGCYDFLFEPILCRVFGCALRLVSYSVQFLHMVNEMQLFGLIVMQRTLRNHFTELYP